MAFDYKKEYKAFYAPPAKPTIVEIPPMNFLAVAGTGNPNTPDGDYSKALNQLYGIAYTLKMSSKAGHAIDGFFDYVVPPLEGLWWQDATTAVDYTRKDDLRWISLLRLPDFITEADVGWAITEATRKKKADFAAVEFLAYHEGLCVQCMHLGSYDDEPATIAAMNDFARANGYAIDINEARRHHEIYLSDPRKTDPAKLKTVIRHPIRKAD